MAPMDDSSIVKPTRYAQVGKRAFDVIAASAFTVVSLPFQAIIALLVRRSVGSPVLFTQERPGLDGEIFSLRKFRTMSDETSSEGELLPESQRITKLGHILRASSLDELPELFNVIAGDMSLVGPRPLLVKYLDRYSAEQARRHAVRPGLTGLAQVSGRNGIIWEDKFALDVEYVDNLSFALDMRILARTVLTVLKREDVSAEGHATAPEFMGSDQTARPRGQ